MLHSTFLLSRFESFNLNLLECKFFDVLINRFLCFVLISTYWNVNRNKYASIENHKSFNLNLLECKSFCESSLTPKSIVLISTYWNVNTEVEPEGSGWMIVLISTYWNVNYSDVNCSYSFAFGFNLNLLECKLEPPLHFLTSMIGF